MNTGRMTQLLLMFFLVSLFLNAQSKEFDIRIAQDKRVRNSSELFSSLRSSNDRERELGLLAIANTQDTTALDSVVLLLNDDSPGVRSMAAFTVGMLGKPIAANALFKRLTHESDEHCAKEILNAVGLCGQADDLRAIVLMKNLYFPSWKPFVAQSIFRFANRNIKDTDATRYAAELLSDPSSKLNATYALMRINDTIIIRENHERLLQQLSDPSPIIRMWTASMAKVFDDETTLQMLFRLAAGDNDWRVRVNAINALRTKLPYKDRIAEFMEDKNEHAALSAVSATGSMMAGGPLDSDSTMLVTILRTGKYFPSVHEEILGLLTQKLGENALPLLGNWRSDSPVLTAKRIRAFGRTHSEKAIPYVKEAITQSDHSLITIAAIEAYQTLVRTSADDSLKKEFLDSVIGLFGKNNAGISYSAASAFEDSAFGLTLRGEYLQRLVSAYNGMHAVSDLEPMVELLNVFTELHDSVSLPAIERGLKEPDDVLRNAAEKAYSAVTGTNAPVRVKGNLHEYKPFYSADDIKKLSLYSGAEVFTSKGKIRIRFEKEAAPFTALNFILLAQKNFYDGLTFHRVVGNFVIQGGDPIGNGSGGPQYTIRTEVHPEALYTEGAVGMASAGKDTEGSQWFITHCPTPHLDYRYTIFGYTRDMDIVDRIMAGDTITTVHLIRGK
ncbi:MAG: peptidylprolyl isomerase [Bacteroidota bacterium]|jgi:peptidylprolyl isomerase